MLETENKTSSADSKANSNPSVAVDNASEEARLKRNDLLLKLLALLLLAFCLWNEYQYRCKSAELQNKQWIIY